MKTLMSYRNFFSVDGGPYQKRNCTNMGDEDNQFCMPTKLSTAEEMPFSDYEMGLIYLYFLGNMNVQNIGGVLASPDKETPGGSYYFHWERDAALSIRTMVKTAHDYPDYSALITKSLRSYVDWCMKVENAKTPNGINILVEPKFELPNVNVFTEPWCRPQNDAPGLKAIALIEYVNLLWDQGENETLNDLISEYLWTKSPWKNKGGIIFHNLEYVVNNWASYTCDIWEEVASNDIFWNRFTMKKALLVGSRFARRLGSHEQADLYDEAVKNIDQAGWMTHWNASLRGSSLYVKEIGAQTLRGWRHVDAAVILAFNHGWDDETRQFAPHEHAVAKTVLEYNRIFTKEYATNTEDTSNQVSGILYGRYPHDNYAGGNPWIMTTAALAHVLYRAATAISKHGLPDYQVMEVWRQALHFELTHDKNDMAIKFATAGDAVLGRIKHHIQGDNFHMFEQIHSNTGKQVGARDLTWSYAETIWAMNARKYFFEVFKANESDTSESREFFSEV